MHEQSLLDLREAATCCPPTCSRLFLLCAAILPSAAPHLAPALFLLCARFPIQVIFNLVEGKGDAPGAVEPSDTKAAAKPADPKAAAPADKPAAAEEEPAAAEGDAAAAAPAEAEAKPAGGDRKGPGRAGGAGGNLLGVCICIQTCSNRSVQQCCLHL